MIGCLITFWDCPDCIKQGQMREAEKQAERSGWPDDDPELTKAYLCRGCPKAPDALTCETPKHCEEDRFGFCPECREPNEHQGYLNVRKSHHMVCGKHRVTWPVGSALFSSWHKETQEDWERNAALIASYEVVEPMYCQCPDCVGRREEVRAEREVGLQTADAGEIPF